MFLKDNGFKYITFALASNNSQQCRDLRIHLLTFRSFYVADSKPPKSRSRSFTVICTPHPTDLSAVLTMATDAKPLQSLVVLPSNGDPTSKLHSSLDKHRANGLFYITYGESTWLQAITLRTGYALNELRFAPGSLMVREHYDLMGLPVRSISLPWDPYFLMNNCSEVTGRCAQESGYLADFVDVVLVRTCNFTYESYYEVNGDWGTTPKANANGTLVYEGGVMGGIVSAEYEMTTSSWIWNAGRDKLLSFVPLKIQWFVLVWIPKKASTDFGLFLRPFVVESWRAMAFLLVSVGVALAAFRMWLPWALTGRATTMVLATVMWYFFVVMHAYYTGAMTMFFTAESGKPLEDIHDLFRQIPNWKLIFRTGMDPYFEQQAAFDTDYSRFVNFVRTNPDVFKFDTLEEGMSKLRIEDKTVMFETTGTLSGKLSAADRADLRVISTVGVEYQHMAVTKDSPLQVAFAWAVGKARERGVEKHLGNVWEGGGGGGSKFRSAAGTSSETVTISLGQMVLAFATLAVALASSLVVLACEKWATRPRRYQKTYLKC